MYLLVHLIFFIQWVGSESHKHFVACQVRSAYAIRCRLLACMLKLK
jgi:hypothetical protein